MADVYTPRQLVTTLKFIHCALSFSLNSQFFEFEKEKMILSPYNFHNISLFFDSKIVTEKFTPAIKQPFFLLHYFLRQDGNEVLYMKTVKEKKK